MDISQVGVWYYSDPVSCNRSEYQCRMAVIVNNQNIVENKSYLTLKLQVRSINSSYATYGYKQTTIIAGTTLAAANFDMRNTNVWQDFGSRDISIQHNANGVETNNKKTASFTTTATGTYSLKNGSIEVSLNLPTIPRYATANQWLIGRSSSAITIGWNSDNIIDAVWYSLNGGNWVLAATPRNNIR